jgi:uncharacterized Ntn-hydrolase superfamily protein
MTFSIAGLCGRTGEIGLALATSSMAAGARAMFLAPGRGAVFAQARSDPALGAYGRARLEAGRSAAETLADMLAHTDLAQWRQLGVLDAAGRTAHATGAKCLEPKGAAEAQGALALGNAVANETVVPAILAGFQAAPDRPLAERLVIGLEAGLAAGGEPYPLRSAALLVGRPNIPFAVIDLRIDLSDTPVAALRHHWDMYVPLVDGYLARAIDPANAPFAAAIESQLR